MNNAFFLTPQIANLIEDFVREIRRGSSLFLLYGEEGVGKSRLLRKLEADRLTDQKVYFVDFDSATQNNSSEYVKQTLAAASGADVIIFDHFDSASKKSQQQIFDSWATDGLDKNLNIIVCANSTGLKRFRQLAQQFQVEAKSFELLPFDPATGEAYLQYILYPEDPFARLVLPGSVKRLLRENRGFFHRIREIADQHGSVIKVKHETESVSRSMPLAIIFSLLLVIVAAGYFIHSTLSSPVLDNLTTQSLSGLDSSRPESGIEAEPVPEPDVEQASSPEPAPQSNPEPEPELGPEVAIKSATSPPVDPVAETEWFDQRLEYSRNWVRNSDASRGTIQIMSIELSRFNSSSFQAYLDKLSEQGLDISEVLIFEAPMAGRLFYSIMYGDYKDRLEAKNQISLLPDIIRSEKPIARSAGSILDGMSAPTEN